MERKKKLVIRLSCGFLAVMAVGTIVSRGAASVLVAQVETEKTGRGKLTYTYNGDGTVVPTKEDQIFLWPEQQVEWIAKQGDMVRAGECLVQFRMEYLQQSIEKKQAELTQLELQASQQEVSARAQARVPAVMGAGQTLAEAQQQLSLAQQKEAEAQAAYDEFTATASQSMNRSIGISDTVKSGTQEEKERENSGEIREGESSANGEGSADGESSVWLSRKQELFSVLQEAHAGVESARQAVTQAQNSYELARQEDAAQDMNAANAAESARLGAEASWAQVEYTRKELERLRSYQASEGKICADRDCTVLQAGVQIGAVTSGAEVLVTGSGGFMLKGLVKAKDKEKLKTGSEVSIQLGAGKKRMVKIESIGMEAGGSAGSGEEITSQDGTDRAGEDTGINASSAQQYFWLASVPENIEVQNSDGFTWEIETPSEKEYEQIIPLSALREDVNDTYCLVLSEEEQMLGTVQIAKKVPVTVIEKDAKSAAVTSALLPEDRIIVSSEKYVSEGNRIRLKE